jgi:hypothetical protein
VVTSSSATLALTRRSKLDRTVKQVMERAGQVITVYMKGSRVAACKGSFRTGQLRAIQNEGDWLIWASHEAIGVGTRADLMLGLKQRLNSIRLTADGVVPLDLGILGCLSAAGLRRRWPRCVHAQ